MKREVEVEAKVEAKVEGAVRPVLHTLFFVNFHRCH